MSTYTLFEIRQQVNKIGLPVFPPCFSERTIGTFSDGSFTFKDCLSEDTKEKCLNQIDVEAIDFLNQYGIPKFNFGTLSTWIVFVIPAEVPEKDIQRYINQNNFLLQKLNQSS